MKAVVNFTRCLPGLACIVSLVAIPSSPPLVCFRRNLQQSSENASATHSGMVVNQTSVSRNMMVRKYGDLPLSFEANNGHADPAVKFFARGPNYSLYLAANQAMMKFRSPTSHPVLDLERRSPAANPESTIVRMKLVGGNAGARTTVLDELP